MPENAQERLLRRFLHLFGIAEDAPGQKGNAAFGCEHDLLERALVAVARRADDREERRRRCRCPRRRRVYSIRQQRLGGHLRAFSNNLYSPREEIVYWTRNTIAGVTVVAPA